MYRERLTEELEDSEPTAKFSLFLNNLFDCLNRRYPGEGIKPDSPDINVRKTLFYNNNVLFLFLLLLLFFNLKFAIVIV